MKIRNNSVNTKPQIIILSSILLFIGLIGTMTIDMYVPSLPYISRDFAINSVFAKYTITFYLITYAFGQFLYGPLTDSFGRKKVLLVSSLIGLLGSALCFIAASISILYIGRLLQGLGYAGISVIAPVIARDVLNDKHFSQVASTLSLIFGLGPVFSPVLGGYINHWLGWHWVFGIISIYTLLVLLIIIFIVPETHTKKNRQIFHLKVITQTWQTILTNKIFITNTLCKSLAFTGFIVFYTVTPFMLQNNLGLNSVQYGWVTLALTGTILLSKLVNIFMLEFVSIERLNYYSAWSLAFAGCLLLLLAVLHYYSLVAVIVPFMIFGIGSGFLFSNTTVAAFKPFKTLSSGSVSGLLNGLQLLTAFIGSVIAAHIGVKTLMPLGILIAAIGVGTLAQYVIFSNPTTLKDNCT